MDGPSSIARLRRALAVLRAAGDPDATWLADGIESYQTAARRGVKLDEVLGLSRGGGGGPWWVVEARERRDAAVRELRAQFFAEVTTLAAATLITDLAHRRERSNAPPATDRDKLVDTALRCGVRFPSSPKQVRAILEIHPPPRNSEVDFRSPALRSLPDEPVIGEFDDGADKRKPATGSPAIA